MTTAKKICVKRVFVQISPCSAKEFWGKDFVFSVAVIQQTECGSGFIAEVFRGKRSEACRGWMFFDEYLEELADRLEMDEDSFIFGITDEDESVVLHELSDDLPETAPDHSIIYLFCTMAFAVLFSALACKTY